MAWTKGPAQALRRCVLHAADFFDVVTNLSVRSSRRGCLFLKEQNADEEDEYAWLDSHVSRRTTDKMKNHQNGLFLLLS